jgi:hypothetical protein
VSQTAEHLTPWWERDASKNADARREHFQANLTEVGDQLARLGWQMPASSDRTPQAIATRIDRLDSFLKICREELLPVKAGDGDVDAADLPTGAPARASSFRTLTRAEEYAVAADGAAVLPHEGDIR